LSSSSSRSNKSSSSSSRQTPWGQVQESGLGQTRARRGWLLTQETRQNHHRHPNQKGPHAHLLPHCTRSSRPRDRFVHRRQPTQRTSREAQIMRGMQTQRQHRDGQTLPGRSQLVAGVDERRDGRRPRTPQTPPTFPILVLPRLVLLGTAQGDQGIQNPSLTDRALRNYSCGRGRLSAR